MGKAFITGGGGGIGLAIARRLARDGLSVTLAGRDGAKLERAAAEIPGADYALCDVTDRAAVEAAIARAAPFHVLVNNAGAARTAPFEKTTDEDWRAQFELNLMGAVHCARAALPILRAQPFARIINIASIAALKGAPYISAYVASKHALLGLTRALAMELARTNITVNALCPAYVDTPMVEAAVENIQAKTGRAAEDARAFLASANPQQRLIRPEEVAAAAAWLASADAGAVNGAAISISGGETG